MSRSLETPLSKVKRGPNRASYDAVLAFNIIDSALLCHVGQTKEGQVFVTPTCHWRDGDYLYWHGHSKARNVKGPIDQPEKVCINMSLLDGLVMARSAFHHSVNYRSVTLFGVPERIDDREEKLRQFKIFLDKVSPGRWEQLRPVNEQEIKATGLVRIKIEEASVKMRAEPPIDDAEDANWPVWAGVIPLEKTWGQGQQDPIQQEDYNTPTSPDAV
ncbi:pyridoxamine 5'-phosphate oxidase family protein [Marinomonas sp. IMCC 4694]|uniref:pyridoxamine 5'-phosphate oxidase family protein n=1 Tax=Marinomonas sp. IMCC 4694 TaxID=2605432 RepID=UPI0011E89555|nr:pyridoxamine 5'-phosphate oxidase family protein [Marinomonas sp. IMCC 4694]TYL46526.1 pyridoxamine 5'-phosphate oxidase family protein [Marinomonas sp. IMCC 4694]